jgi:hypothetical protein
MDQNKAGLIALTLLLVIVAGGAYIALAQPGFMPGASTSGTGSSSAETPYGESIEISIGGESQTSGAASWFQKNPEAVASWFASYQNSDSQNVYTVNSTYKSQETVTIESSLAVTWSNVQSLTATVKVKAIDKGTPTNNHEYTLANNIDIQAASPTSDNWNTAPSINAHLTSVGGSTTSETIEYQVYCQVTATGTISGDTLTATIAYTPYGTLVYDQSSEANSATVTPSVSVTSYYDQALGLPDGALVTMLAILVIAACAYVVYDQVKG